MTVWIVRGGRSGEGRNGDFEDDNLRDNIVTMGWFNSTDLTNVDTKKAIESVYDHDPETLDYVKKHNYKDSGKGHRINTASQVFTIRNEILINDIVIMPGKGQEYIAFGKVIGSYAYRPISQRNPEGRNHTIPMIWINKEVPRSSFDQDIQTRLNHPLTVYPAQPQEPENHRRDYEQSMLNVLEKFSS